jgi:hypothetical protein
MKLHELNTVVYDAIEQSYSVRIFRRKQTNQSFSGRPTYGEWSSRGTVSTKRNFASWLRDENTAGRGANRRFDYRIQLLRTKQKRLQSNPPVEIYGRILSIEAQKIGEHKCDAACKRYNHKYRHEFKSGTKIYGMPDGSLEIK